LSVCIINLYVTRIDHDAYGHKCYKSNHFSINQLISSHKSLPIGRDTICLHNIMIQFVYISITTWMNQFDYVQCFTLFAVPINTHNNILYIATNSNTVESIQNNIKNTINEYVFKSTTHIKKHYL